ncbi:MAG TPA: TetR family transcriptional regulator [Solirubrobacteraceae bacterium]|nr:TetR family transcriptional regulator [Solirubrobacteraceae bacterium]
MGTKAKETPKRVSPKRVASERTVRERTVPEPVASERVVSERVVSERVVPERVVPSRLTVARNGLRRPSNLARQSLDELGPANGPERVLSIQRARILAGMVEECARRGAASVSVAHVVGRAGVSRRTFYEVFQDREDCFLAAFDDGVARATQCALAGYNPSARWAERLRAALVGLLRFLDVESDMGRLLIVGSLGAGARALARRRDVLAQLTAAVDEGRDLSKAGDEFSLLTAEGVVGGVLSVLHSRLQQDTTTPLVELTSPLMSMIVLPYLGPAAARRELARPVPLSPRAPAAAIVDPLRELGMRLTYRTVRVLLAVASHPGGSNRQVADGSGIADQGQISKLLARLQGLGLIENTGAGFVRGAPNSWVLTDRGWKVQAALARNTA